MKRGLDRQERMPTTEPTSREEGRLKAARIRSEISTELRDLKAAQAASRERASNLRKIGDELYAKARKQETRASSFTPAILRREDALKYLDERVKVLYGETSTPTIERRGTDTEPEGLPLQPVGPRIETEERSGADTNETPLPPQPTGPRTETQGTDNEVGLR